MPKIISLINKKERKALWDLKTDLEAKRILPVLKRKKFFGLTIQNSLHKASEKNVLDVQMSQTQSRRSLT